MIVRDKLSIVTEAIKINIPLILFSVAYWVLGFLLTLVFRVNQKPLFYASIFYLLGFILLSAVFIVSFYLIYVCLIVRPDSPFIYISDKLSETRFFTRLVHAAISLLTLLIFISATLEMKSIIPFAKPFCFDYFFMKLDAFIHGGPPWMYLHKIIDSPLAIGTIDNFYSLWFFVFYAVLIWQGFSIEDMFTRMRFFYSFVLCWVILGNLLALLLSSAGPCYYEKVVGVNEYRGLFSSLLSVDQIFPIHALNIQALVWDNYTVGSPEPIKSISAMPSMHVSLAFLWFLLSFRFNFLFKMAMGFYFIMILIGSVALGWHYAIDGYLAILGTWLIWWVAGHILRNKDSFCQAVTKK